MKHHRIECTVEFCQQSVIDTPRPVYGSNKLSENIKTFMISVKVNGNSKLHYKFTPKAPIK